MNIGLDFDGVISDCGKLKSDGAKKLYGVDIPPSKFKKEIVVGEGLLTVEQYRELQAIIYGTREMGLLMEPVEGVLHFLPRLVSEGNSVLVVTSREEAATEIAREWAEVHGLQLTFASVGYGKSKAEAAQGLNFYIDDDFEKLEPLVGVVPHRYLFSWGYNAHVDIGDALSGRIASWEELYRTVQVLKGGR